MLTFNETLHEYRYNGIVVPSVTQVIKLAGLSSLDNVPQELLRRNAEFGTAVHKAIELKCKNILDESSVHEAINPYLRAWDDFVLDFQYFSSQVEYRAFNSSLRIGLTIDNIGSIHNESTIIDVKTGGYKPSDEIQISAYGYCFPAKRRLLVYLSDKGYKVVEVKGADFKRNVGIFLAALSLVNWKKEKGIL